MRLCVDASPFLLRSAGIKNYLYHWLSHLQRHAAPGDRITAFPFLGPVRSLDHERSLVGPVGTYARLGALYGANLLPPVALDWMLGRVDLFHSTNQVRQPPRRVPVTATVYDMTCWLVPELHLPANVRAEKAFAERVLRQARGLIAISEQSRTDALRILALPPERIRVVYPGVIDAYFSVEANSAREVATRLGLAKPYLLYVGTIEPRKNVDTLLDAYAQLPPGLQAEFDLVLAGPMGWAAPHTAARLQQGQPGVRYLGYVPEADLPGLTAGATAFAYPSLYEGFGFPLAQAMAAGVPSVTSTASCLPEVAGDGALLADPHSPSDLAAALERLLTSPTLRQTLAAAGRARATRYRWSTSAEQSLAFFRSVL